MEPPKLKETERLGASIYIRIEKKFEEHQDKLDFRDTCVWKNNGKILLSKQKVVD